MNFDFIIDTLVVGSAPETTADVQTLLDAGVTYVINCRIEQDDEVLFAGKFKYLWDGVPDWTDEVPLGNQPLPLSFFQKAFAFWPPSPSPYSPEVLLCHCTMGYNRSMILAFAFLVAEGKSPDEAMLLLDEKRPVAGIWNTVMDAPWRKDAENALRTLGYNFPNNPTRV